MIAFPPRVFLLLFAAILAAEAAHGASAQWVGTTDGNWSTATNWSPNAAPGTGDQAIFGWNNGGHPVISLGAAGVTVSTIGFDNNQQSYTIGAGAVGSEQLTLNHSGYIFIGDTFTGQHDQFINADLVLGTNANAATYSLYSYHDGNTLFVAGDVSGGTGGTAGAKTLRLSASRQLNAAAPSLLTVSGVIGGGGGTLAVTKAGPGIVTLTGNNTFTGLLTIEQGTVSIPVFNNAGADGPLGHSAGAITIDAVSTYYPPRIEYTGPSAVSSKKIAIAGTGGFVEISVANAATELTLSGVISGTNASINKTGPGTLILSGANTYGNGTSISGGTLRLLGSGTPGATGGYLSLSSRFEMNGESYSCNSLSGYGSATIVNNGTGTSLLTINTTSPTGNFPGTIKDRDNASTGILSLTKSGTGFIYIGGRNDYSGPTLVTNGTLYVGNDTGLGNATGGTTVSSGATLGLFLTGPGASPEAITISGAGEAGEEGALEGYGTCSGLLKLGAAATMSATAADPSFHFTNPGIITGSTFTLTLAGTGEGEINSVIGTTSGGIVKNGGGKWTLTGANTFTGAVSVQNGILSVPVVNAPATDGPLGRASTAITLGSTGGVTGTLQYTGSATAATGRPLTLASGGVGRVEITEGSAILTVSGVVAGAGKLSKTGAGLLALTASSTFGGGAEVVEGTLLVNNTTGSGAGAGLLDVLSAAGGSGTISGQLKVRGGATFSPGGDSSQTGFGLGTFKAGNFALLSGSTIQLQVKSPTERDRLTTTGAMNIEDGVVFIITAFPGFAPIAGQSYDLADWGSRTGSANPAALMQLPTLPAGLAWDKSGFAATGQVTIIAQAKTYAAWKTANFTAAEQSNPAISDETADPDRDGLTNLMEYALGTLPKMPDSSAIVAPIVNDAGDSYFGIHFIRTLNTSDLDWAVQISDDPDTGPWITVAPPFTSSHDNGDGTEFVEWHAAAPGFPAAPAKFIRLKVVKAP